MNVLKYIPKGATAKASRALLQLQKSSPTTLFIVGGVGVVATAVLASKATLRTSDLISEGAMQRLDDANELRDLTGKEKAQLAGKIARIYAPTIVVGAATIGALTGSHRILTSRNTAATAAYAALTDVYTRYQQRVAEEIGEDKEKAIRLDLEKKTFEEDGKSVKYKAVGPDADGLYSRFFDESCPSWSKSAENNLLFLTLQQNYLNDKLRAKGHVFLNEVYDALGMERSSAGQLVGWVKDSKNGDSYIDFGLYENDTPEGRAFLAGRERSVYLTFNVDGIVYDLIGKQS